MFGCEIEPMTTGLAGERSIAKFFIYCSHFLIVYIIQTTEDKPSLRVGGHYRRPTSIQSIRGFDLLVIDSAFRKTTKLFVMYFKVQLF